MTEVTKIFCATHELEIDLLIQLHEAMSKPSESSKNLEGERRKTRDYASFTKILPMLGIEANKISASKYYLQCNRGQEYFVEWVLDNTSRFESGGYKPLIQKCAACLNIV